MQAASLITLPPCMWRADRADVLMTASSTPPVTPESINQLQLLRIQNNIEVRAELQYNHNVHYLPISGPRAEQKRVDADRYWQALECEVRISFAHPSKSCDLCDNTSEEPLQFPQRLPTLFHMLRELLLILTPDQDHELVRNMLDVELLMQQIRERVLDVSKLAACLSDLLTAHCAPLHDNWAFEIRKKISEGAQGDIALTVSGLSELFSFCETMKLDDANHQIRKFRSLLITDGVTFQRDYYQCRIRSGKLDPQPSIDWYLSCSRWSPASPPCEYSGLAFGLILLVAKPGEIIPEFFTSDTSRIERLREDLSDLVHLEACWDLYCDKHMVHNDNGRQVFESRLLDLTEGESIHEPGSSLVWESHLNSLATELAGRVLTGSRWSGETVPFERVAGTVEELREKFDKGVEGRIETLKSELLDTMLRYVSDFKRLSALELSQLQQNHQQSAQNRRQGRYIPNKDDIARRMAHIAVIHWRVWCDWYSYAALIA